jgi:hypothetical protein
MLEGRLVRGSPEETAKSRVILKTGRGKLVAGGLSQIWAAHMILKTVRRQAKARARLRNPGLE